MSMISSCLKINLYYIPESLSRSNTVMNPSPYKKLQDLFETPSAISYISIWNKALLVQWLTEVFGF